MDFAPKSHPSVKPQSSAKSSRISTGSMKKFALFAVIIAVIAGVGLVGTKLTGLVISNPLAQQLNETQHNLTICQSGLLDSQNQYADCQSNAGTLQAALDTCGSEKTGLETSLNDKTSALNQCNTDKILAEAEKDTAVAQYDQAKADYDKIAENYALDVCCTRGITQAQWSIQNNAIVCSGDKTVDCTA